MKLWVLIMLSIGHLVTDIHQGAIPILLPYLRDSFTLSYFQLGLIVLVANLSSSVIQPLFGLYSDKTNIPWLMPLGIGMAATGIALAGLMPNYYLILIAVFISGLGIAAYHPEGSKMANFAAGSKKSSAMSIFSVGGNLGFGIGPILGAVFFGTWGLTGSLAFLGPGLITAAVFLFFQSKMMADTSESRDSWRKKREDHKANGTGKMVWSWGLMLLMMAVVFRSWTQFGLINYMYFYYTDYLGGEPKIAAMLIGVFGIAGAVGTLVGGLSADRIGAKKHFCISLALASPLLYLFLHTSGIAALVVIALAGAVLISSFAPTVVMGQQYLPNNIGLASGLLIGFAIGIGGLGVPVLGIFADKYGVDLVMKIIAMLPIIGFSLALLLPAPPEAVSQQSVGPISAAE
ncbi:MAG: MFS transporter [Clostridia bacterium]|jgi:FSR family fosmidomycin resistance protein-like MFS transporter|nr:MFS transporter [Clostridia bacterium]